MIEPTIVLGPPGTGKTTTLLDTVEMEMERGVPPDRIGFFTFTKRGVEEGISRASARFNLPRSNFRFFNTLHSAAFRHLGLSSSQVFTGKKLQEFGQENGFDIRGGLSSDDGTYSSFYGEDIYLFLENYARITRTPIEEVLRDYEYALPSMDINRATRCINLLRGYKMEHGLYDFTDMIEEFIKLEDPPRLEVLIVDEAQDLSEIQWEMVSQLARHVKRMYAAGDDDQTIFTWAGASERFITMPGDVTVLRQSFRVPRSVHELANHVIAEVQNRRPKEWNPRDEEGSVRYLDDMSRLRPLDVARSDTMMLARTVKMLRQKFVSYCRLTGLPYRYFEHNSIKPTHAEAIMAWNELQNGQRISADRAVRVYDLLSSEGHGKVAGVKRGGKSSLGRVADQPEPPMVSMEELQHGYGLIASGKWNEIFTQIHAQDVAYIEKVLNNGFNLSDKPKIHISTIHRVKGGQANNVFLLSNAAKAADDMFRTNRDEEARVYYTGVTRTFKNLIILRPDRGSYHERLIY